jgi:hypothetical protein
MARDTSVRFRVTAQMKAQLSAVAAREQISESALVRQLVEAMLRVQPQSQLPTDLCVDRPRRDERLYVRLAAEDQMMLRRQAGVRGLRGATYVSLLVRSHLRGVTPIPEDELLALKRSIAELRALGNNLNQIAKSLHQGKPGAPGLEHVATMLKIAGGLRDHFKSLLIANEQSWRQGHADVHR